VPVNRSQGQFWLARVRRAVLPSEERIDLQWYEIAPGSSTSDMTVYELGAMDTCHAAATRAVPQLQGTDSLEVDMSLKEDLDQWAQQGHKRRQQERTDKRARQTDIRSVDKKARHEEGYESRPRRPGRRSAVPIRRRREFSGNDGGENM
jgi:hypothetical protein